jgi:hypothetical protein
MNNEPGYVKGKHFTEYIDEVKQLRRDGNTLEVVPLLLELVAATENESKSKGYGVAPWYYEQLAIVYRKIGSVNDEIEILERFSKQKHARGVKPAKLILRLERLRNKA